MWYGEGRRFGYVRVTEESDIDLHGRNLLATTIDYLRHAAVEGKEPLLVYAAEVAGAIPTVFKGDLIEF